MELILEDKKIRERQKAENRERKRRIKSFLKAQEERGAVGGHDKTGTRVHDGTALKRPSLPGKESFVLGERARALQQRPVESLVDEDLKAHRNAQEATPSTPQVCDACIATPPDMSPLELPLCPQQSIPKRSHRRRAPKACTILKNEGQTLGRGSFGVVYMGLNTANGELVAVKEMSLQKGSREQLDSLVREISLMKRLTHPNIVRYYGAARSDSGVQIFMEYVPGGSLRRIVTHFGKLEEHVVRMYSRQMLLGLGYLHSQGVAHLDIKADNALLGVTGEVKLTDFGASEKLDECSTRSVGTPCFMAPEVIKGTGHTVSADIWSIGITLLELLEGDPPSYGLTDAIAVMYRIASVSSPPPPPEDVSPECQEFIKSCLQRHPLDRPTVQQLLLLPFMQEHESDDDEEYAREKATNECPTAQMVEPAWRSVFCVASKEGLEGAAATLDTVSSWGVSSKGGAGADVAATKSISSQKSVNFFVRSAGLKMVTNSVSDLTYLRKLTTQKEQNLISEFELQAKKSALFGMSVSTPLQQCGVLVSDVGDSDVF